MRGLVASLVSVLALCVPALAQQSATAEAEAAEPASDEVVLFEGRNFEGESLRYEVGDDVADLTKIDQGNWRNRVSSIKVGSDVQLALWSWVDHRNMCIVLKGSNAGGATGRYPDLGKWRWDNLIKSLRVLDKEAKSTGCR